ncbi:MAG: hypothetical protein Tsb006_0250 [Rickettsiaceae bacterium]
MTSKLKEAREKAGYTVEEVSEILKIRKQYIINLEEENFENMPGKIYVKGYTKVYYEFLGLDLPQDGEPHVVEHKAAGEESGKVWNKIIALIALVLLVIVVFAYSALKNCEVW